MSNRSSELLNCDDVNDERTLQDLLEPVNNPNGTTDFTVKEVIPTPGFVVKTRDESGHKVFINICGCDQIPAPENWKHGVIPEDVLQALRSSNEQNSDLSAIRFPLSLSVCRSDVDKQGQPCTVYDCLFNLYVVSEAKFYKELRIFLIGLALNWLTEKNHLKLDSDYKVPRLAYKGKDIAPHRIKVKKGPAVQEIEDIKTNQHSSEFCFRFGKSNHKIEKKPTQKSDKKPNQEIQPKPKEVKEPKDQSSPDWKHELSFVGKPVTKMNLLLDLPETLKEECPEVSLSGLELKILFQESDACCNISLPFASHHETSEVVVDYRARQMRLQIPVMPISELLDSTSSNK